MEGVIRLRWGVVDELISRGRQGRSTQPIKLILAGWGQGWPGQSRTQQECRGSPRAASLRPRGGKGVPCLHPLLCPSLPAWSSPVGGADTSSLRGTGELV